MIQAIGTRPKHNKSSPRGDAGLHPTSRLSPTGGAGGGVGLGAFGGMHGGLEGARTHPYLYLCLFPPHSALTGRHEIRTYRLANADFIVNCKARENSYAYISRAWFVN